MIAMHLTRCLHTRLDRAEHEWTDRGWGANYDAEADAVEAKFDARFGASL